MKSAKQKRSFGLPPHFEALIEAELRVLNYTLSEPGKLTRAVQRLSDFYILNPDGATPWHEPWARAASLVYYFPLNYARNRAVATEASRLGFFDDLETLVDLGCGTGSGLLAFSDAHAFKNRHGSDISADALEIVARLAGSSPDLDLQHGYATSSPRAINKNTLYLASYLYTELEVAPSWWSEAEALALVEPSAKSDARRLQTYRAELIAKGFEIWAPCTHLDACPLLVHSEKDWCHDRIHWIAPKWFEMIEKNLPMKNRTLTFSYLLARRSRPAPTELKSLARLVGDTLVEKGKNRQAVCRGSAKEYLAWFPQRLPKTSAIELDRGSLVELIGQGEIKGDEVRLESQEKIRELPPAAPLF